MNKEKFRTVKNGDWVRYLDPTSGLIMDGKVVADSFSTIFGKPLVEVRTEIVVSFRNRHGQFSTASKNMQKVTLSPKDIISVQ